MARKARHRISYVLPLPNSAGGHRLGVNGLAVNAPESRLYSGGRDGSICTWDLHLDLQSDVLSDFDSKPAVAQTTTLRQQVQAHTHWINDLVFSQPHQALVSASSDVTVKLWRPTSSDGQPPQTIGLHSDYVKKLAMPSSSSDWIASGGLDRKIQLWDLQGGGSKLGVRVVDDDDSSTLLSVEKGSVYALAATDTIIASGGPEKTVRVWDARSGTRITKLVGHTDMVRDILISQDGTTILTASSDRTVKLWSTAAGRCMYTLTMHDASVWSLFSDHPNLSVFYSSDRSGLVAKTDTRNVSELDEGLSVAMAQEHEGVFKVVAAGDYIWTATSRPSINRWRNLATENLEIDLPERYASFSQQHRTSTTAAHVRYPSLPGRREISQNSGLAAVSTESLPSDAGGDKRKIPLKHVLRLSNTAFFPSTSIFENLQDPRNTPGHRSSTIEGPSAEDVGTQAVRAQPDASIEGQNGLIKHTMMSDRRRVLTLDTAGEVVMWDLLQCVPVRSFGKRHLEDVRDEETPAVPSASTANWCTVDTRTGSLTVVLEEHTCFDAEVYADELTDTDAAGVEFREDTRVNLGKWLLRYLFARFIDEEIRRDQEYRSQLLFTHENKRFVPPPRTDSSSGSAPLKITLPARILNGWSTTDSSALSSASTLRPDNTRASKAPLTPSFNIALATPALTSPIKPTVAASGTLTPLGDQEGSAQQPTRSSSDRETDYFSAARGPSADLATTPGSHLGSSSTPSEAAQEPSTPQVDDTTAKENSTPGKEGLFGKKFRMGMSFGSMKKLGRTTTNDKLTSAAAIAEEKDESDDNKSTKNSARGGDTLDDTLFGMLQRMHHAYDESLLHQVQNQQAKDNGLPVAAPSTIDLPSAITPSLPDETPVLKPPRNTILLIQEDRPEAGGVADLFEGTVGALDTLADSVEKAAPAWLGDVLLKNRLPHKDIAKTSFILEPWGGALPSISADGNNRLNANRMLRAKKVCAYVAERIEPQPSATEEKAGEPAALRPEEYLELWCQDKLVPPNMTLFSIRTHLWKGPGNDVVLQYKSNGRKELPTFIKQPGIPI